MGYSAVWLLALTAAVSMTNQQLACLLLSTLTCKCLDMLLVALSGSLAVRPACVGLHICG
jgi:hypothetical protein